MENYACFHFLPYNFTATILSNFQVCIVYFLNISISFFKNTAFCLTIALISLVSDGDALEILFQLKNFESSQTDVLNVSVVFPIVFLIPLSFDKLPSTIAPNSKEEIELLFQFDWRNTNCLDEVKVCC